MYLKMICLKNIGPIDEICLQLPFDQENKPKPIIFAGENGTGKTIILSSMVDGLYEFGNKLFDNVLPRRGNNYQYYKLGSVAWQKINSTFCFVALEFALGTNRYEYLDKIGNVGKENILTMMPQFKLTPDGKDSHNKQITDIDKKNIETTTKEFLSEPHFYLPANRYEEPFWKNQQLNLPEYIAEKRNYRGRINKEIEILTSLDENKSFLLDFVLDYCLSKENNQSMLHQSTWDNINEILRKIKQNNDIRFGIGRRGGSRISIINQKTGAQYLPSIDNLSLGEQLLLNLFINILRHAGNDVRVLNEIKGIVIVDEIDAHLHTNLQRYVLPELIKMFPRIQFIMTSHAPLFLLGMEQTFGEDGYVMIDMPSGNSISVERFTEFGKAYESFKQTKTYEDDIEKQIKTSNMPLVFCEGDTDVRHITKAANSLGKTKLLNAIRIAPVGYQENGQIINSGVSGLNSTFNLLKGHNSKLNGNKVVLLYDFDARKSPVDIDEILYVRSTNENKDNQTIEAGIENLYPGQLFDNEEIKRECFSVKKIPNNYGPNTEQVRLDKEAFCSWIEDNGTKEHFTNFLPLFAMLEEIFLGSQLSTTHGKVSYHG